MRTFILGLLMVSALSRTIAQAQSQPWDSKEKLEADEQKMREQWWANDWPGVLVFRHANEQVGLPAKGENRVVFMGNSIFQGWGQLRPEFFAGKPYVNRGISGQTTPKMLIRFRQDVINLKAKVVVILAGTNDIAENDGPTTPEMIENNLASMIDLAQANGVKVVLVSILPAQDYPWRKGLDPYRKIPVINAWMKQYAKEKKFVFLDLYAQMVVENGAMNPKYSDEGVHPNVEGYKFMEPLVEEAIQKALKNK